MNEEAFCPRHKPVSSGCKKLAEPRARVLPVCAKLEQEIAELEPGKKKRFWRSWGFPESGLDRIVTFHTVCSAYLVPDRGEPEVRAWTITEGTKAPQAAGKIHSDFERGFIRAEVVAYEDLIGSGSLAAARESALSGAKVAIM
jgi:ribosome-binding ATPase YchF (GTP1/OBG family)